LRVRHVTRITLEGSELNGPLIPSELLQFTQLQQLELTGIKGASNSTLDGLHALTNLGFLTIGNNDALVGTLPSELATLPYLQELMIAENAHLRGAIPSEFGSMGALMNLQLFRNALGGTVPSELGKLGMLMRLYLFQNRLHGLVPTELLNLKNLRECRLFVSDALDTAARTHAHCRSDQRVTRVTSTSIGTRVRPSLKTCRTRAGRATLRSSSRAPPRQTRSRNCEKKHSERRAHV
jgi:hypothetical protein